MAPALSWSLLGYLHSRPHPMQTGSYHQHLFGLTSQHRIFPKMPNVRDYALPFLYQILCLGFLWAFVWIVPTLFRDARLPLWLRTLLDFLISSTFCICISKLCIWLFHFRLCRFLDYNVIVIFFLPETRQIIEKATCSGQQQRYWCLPLCCYPPSVCALTKVEVSVLSCLSPYKAAQLQFPFTQLSCGVLICSALLSWWSNRTCRTKDSCFETALFGFCGSCPHLELRWILNHHLLHLPKIYLSCSVSGIHCSHKAGWWNTSYEMRSQ